MVVIPPGEFTMGSSEARTEGPTRTVKFEKPFAVGRHEVTFAEWDACFDAKGCKHRPNDNGWGRGNLPVVGVSWDDTQEFLAWLSAKSRRVYRLLTEAEWEYSSRAGTTSAYWWGRSLVPDLANCQECGGESPRRSLPVGSFRPNAFGLFDASGNAAEWVEDCWNESYKGAPAEPKAWLSGQCRLRVLRGGSFGSKATDVR